MLQDIFIYHVIFSGVISLELFDRAAVSDHEPAVPVLLLCAAGVLLVFDAVRGVCAATPYHCRLHRTQPAALFLPGRQAGRPLQRHYHTLHVRGTFNDQN
jgi:hypothetical protein